MTDGLSKKTSSMRSLKAISADERPLARYIQRLANSLFWLQIPLTEDVLETSIICEDLTVNPIMIMSP